MNILKKVLRRKKNDFIQALQRAKAWLYAGKSPMLL